MLIKKILIIIVAIITISSCNQYTSFDNPAKTTAKYMLLPILNQIITNTPNIAISYNSTNIQNGGNCTDFSVPFPGTNSLTFTITNTGLQELQLTGSPVVSISGSGSGAYAISSQPSQTLIASGASTNFTVTFTPPTAALHLATITIPNNDPDSNQYGFTAAGTGSVVPEIDVRQGAASIASGGNYSFSNVLVGNYSDITFTIRNTGTYFVILSNTPLVSLSGDPVFSVTTQPASSINPGGSTTFVVRFTPAAETSYSSTLTIMNNDADEGTYVIILTGNGKTDPDINIKQRTLSIASGTTYNIRHTRVNVARYIEFTVENTGSDTLNLNGSPNVEISGDTQFTVSAQPSSSVIAPGGSTTFTVKFLPTAASAYNATLTINNDDPDSLESPYTIPLAGSGINAWQEQKLSFNTANSTSYSMGLNEMGEMISASEVNYGANYDIFYSDYRFRGTNWSWDIPAGSGDSANKLSITAMISYEAVSGIFSDGSAAVQFNGGISPGLVFKADFTNGYPTGTWVKPSGSDYISYGSNTTMNNTASYNKHGDMLIAWIQDDSSAKKQVFKWEKTNSVITAPGSFSDNISPDGTDASNDDPDETMVFIKTAVSVNTNRDAIIVWRQDNGSREQLYMSHRIGGVWYNPASTGDTALPGGRVSINSTAVKYFDIAINDFGHAAIVWKENSRIYYIYYNGSSWTSPVLVCPDEAGADFPSVALNNSGKMYIVWQQSYSFVNYIYIREYNDGTPIVPNPLPTGVGGFLQVNKNNISLVGFGSFYPKVALNDNNDYIIIWREDPTSGAVYRLYKKEYLNGSWINPSGVNDYVNKDYKYNSEEFSGAIVLMNNNGSAAILWNEKDTSGYYQTFVKYY
jgi:hypothetical protein